MLTKSKEYNNKYNICLFLSVMNSKISILDIGYCRMYNRSTLLEDIDY